VSSVQQHNHYDVNLSTLSPNPSGRNTLVDYQALALTTGDEMTTQDMSKINQFKSAAKIKMKKRHGSFAMSPHQQSQNSTMKPIRNPTWDSDAALPKVKGAFRKAK